jgi:hypothetical protein
VSNQASFALRGRNPDVLTCIANLSNDEVFTPPELANRMLDTLTEAWAAGRGAAHVRECALCASRKRGADGEGTRTLCGTEHVPGPLLRALYEGSGKRVLFDPAGRADNDQACPPLSGVIRRQRTGCESVRTGRVGAFHLCLGSMTAILNGYWQDGNREGWTDGTSGTDGV